MLVRFVAIVLHFHSMLIWVTREPPGWQIKPRRCDGLSAPLV